MLLGHLLQSKDDLIMGDEMTITVMGRDEMMKVEMIGDRMMGVGMMGDQILW